MINIIRKNLRFVFGLNMILCAVYLLSCLLIYDLFETSYFRTNYKAYDFKKETISAIEKVYDAIPYVSSGVLILWFINMLLGITYGKLYCFVFFIAFGWLFQSFFIHFGYNHIVGDYLPIKKLLLMALNFSSISSIIVLFQDLIPDNNNEEEIVRGAVVAYKSIYEGINNLLNFKFTIGNHTIIVGDYVDYERLEFIADDKINEHIFLVGSTGVGKSQLMHRLIDKAMPIYKDRLFILDFKGEYIQTVSERSGVRILAPWDKRSIKWAIGKDIKTLEDCAQFAEIIIPANLNSNQEYFPNSARQIFETILKDLLSKNQPWSWEDIVDYFSEGKDELINKIKLENKEKIALEMIRGDGKAAQDVYSTLLSSIKTIKKLAKAWPGNDGYSLREVFINDEIGTLIIGGMPKYGNLSKDTANLAIRIIVDEVLSNPDKKSGDGRTWLFLDELTALGKSESIYEALIRGRSKNLACIVSAQDVSQIEHNYGNKMAQSMLNSFYTTIIFRCGDISTAEWASKYLGEQEVKQRIKSIGKSNDSSKNDLLGNQVTTESITYSFRNKRVFLPSEISNLPTLTGLIRIVGKPIEWYQWKFENFIKRHPVYIPANWVNELPKRINDDNAENSDRKWDV